MDAKHAMFPDQPPASAPVVYAQLSVTSVVDAMASPKRAHVEDLDGRCRAAEFQHLHPERIEAIDRQMG